MITGLSVGMQSVVLPIACIILIIFISTELTGLYGLVLRLWYVVHSRNSNGN